MEKYKDLSENVVSLLGGKGNISFYTHCVTRLRFNVKDRSLVEKEKIDSLEKVVGSQWSGEQFQIIIGQSVKEAYNAIEEKNHIAKKDDETVENTQSDKKKKLSFNSILDGIAGCITPLIPLMIGSGMIKVLILLLQMTNLLSENSPTINVLTFVSDAGFYFLPIFVGATAAKKFNTNIGLGMLMGGMLLHPTFISNVAEGQSISVFSLPIYSANYGNMIFPTILAVFVMSYVERFFTKYSFDSIKAMSTPLLTILVMTPLNLVLLAPIGAFLGTFLTDGIMWIYNTVGFLGVGILSSLMSLMILTGMHTALSPYLIQSMATLGKEPIIFVANFVNNFNQGIACLAVALKTKDKTLRSTALSCAVTAIVGGVTEPALFGVNLKLKKPLYAVMIGSFFGGALAGFLKVYCYSFVASGGLFGLAAFIGPEASNLMFFILSLLLGMVITFLATLFMYKDGIKQ